ncbi:MAG: DUF1573 domain-containing protein, partial [Thermoguttaceae bacterium]|nr:DUF1573 domain-containing protein [Thermoguttaceae bacterium]
MAAPIFRALCRRAFVSASVSTQKNADKSLSRSVRGSSVFVARTLVFAALLFLLPVPSIYAQQNQWAVKMFSELGTVRAHDFGSVALHAEVERRFAFKNIYKEDVVISSVSSNCGCTKASASKTVIRSGETAEIIARVDTSGRQHTKGRKATITVVFSKPALAEVQMQVKTYIRADVGFDPGSIEFGTTTQGKSVVKRAYLQYEGRPDWALIGVQKTNPGIRAEAREARRTATGVVYEILVELKANAEPGYIHDLLKFKTNDPDPATSSIFLPIRGVVTAPLTAKPSYLQLGVVPKNATITKNLVVCGATPFQILSVDSKDKRMSFLKTDLKRTVHVIPVTFRAGSQTGAISETIVVATSQKNEAPLRVAATGYVVDAEAPATAPEEEDVLQLDATVSNDVEPTLTPAESAPKVAALLSTDDENAEPIRFDPVEETDAKTAPTPKASRRGARIFDEFPRHAPPVKKRFGAADRSRPDGVASASASLPVRPLQATPVSAALASDAPNAVRPASLTAPVSPALASVANSRRRRRPLRSRNLFADVRFRANSFRRRFPEPSPIRVALVDFFERYSNND